MRRNGATRPPAALVASCVCVRDAARGHRRIGAPGRALVGPLLFVTRPQRLQTADDRDDGVVSAAADNEIMELTADFGEQPTIFEVLGHGIVDLLEFWNQRVGPV